jgi:hypothetical protein
LIFSLLLLLLLWWLFGDWKDASLKASTRVFWRFIYFDFFVFVWLREMSGGDVKVFISFLMIYIMHSLSILHLEQVEWAGGGESTHRHETLFFFPSALWGHEMLLCVCSNVCRLLPWPGRPLFFFPFSHFARSAVVTCRLHFPFNPALHTHD